MQPNSDRLNYVDLFEYSYKLSQILVTPQPLFVWFLLMPTLGLSSSKLPITRNLVVCTKALPQRLLSSGLVALRYVCCGDLWQSFDRKYQANPHSVLRVARLFSPTRKIKVSRTTKSFGCTFSLDALRITKRRIHIALRADSLDNLNFAKNIVFPGFFSSILPSISVVTLIASAQSHSGKEVIQ